MQDNRPSRDKTGPNDTANRPLSSLPSPPGSPLREVRMITMPLHLGVRIMTNNSSVKPKALTE